MPILARGRRTYPNVCLAPGCACVRVHRSDHVPLQCGSICRPVHLLHPQLHALQSQPLLLRRCVGAYAGPPFIVFVLLRTRGRARLATAHPTREHPATTSHARPSHHITHTTREHLATTSHKHARPASRSSLPCARSVAAFVRFSVGGAAWTVPEPHCLRCTGRDGGGRCGRGRVVLPRRARRMRRERGRRAAAGRHARAIVCARAARRRSCWNISRVTSYIRGPLAQRYSLNFMPTVSTDCVARVA